MSTLESPSPAPPPFRPSQGTYADTLTSTTLIATLPPSPPFVLPSVLSLADGGLAANLSTGTYLRTAGTAGLLPTGASPRTVAGWVYVESSTTGYGLLVSYGSTSSHRALVGLSVGYYFGMFGYFYDCVVPNLAAPLGAWTHAAFTYDGATVVVYQNGTVRACACAVRAETPLLR